MAYVGNAWGFLVPLLVLPVPVCTVGRHGAFIGYTLDHALVEPVAEWSRWKGGSPFQIGQPVLAVLLGYFKLYSRLDWWSATRSTCAVNRRWGTAVAVWNGPWQDRLPLDGTASSPPVRNGHIFVLALHLLPIGGGLGSSDCFFRHLHDDFAVAIKLSYCFTAVFCDQEEKTNARFVLVLQLVQRIFILAIAKVSNPKTRSLLELFDGETELSFAGVSSHAKAAVVVSVAHNTTERKRTTTTLCGFACGGFWTCGIWRWESFLWRQLTSVEALPWCCSLQSASPDIASSLLLLWPAFLQRFLMGNKGVTINGFLCIHISYHISVWGENLRLLCLSFWSTFWFLYHLLLHQQHKRWNCLSI